MAPRRLVRAVVALAVPALLVGTLGSPAEAMPTAPETPSVNAVARVLPQLKNGFSLSLASRVKAVRKNCTPGEAFAGSTQRETSYLPAGNDLSAIVTVTSARFATRAEARRYLSQAGRAKCLVPRAEPGEPRIRTSRVRFHVGARQVGYKAVQTDGRHTVGGYFLLTTRGRNVELVEIFSLSRHLVPERKAVRLIRMALRTAR